MLDENVLIYGVESESIKDAERIAAAQFIRCLQTRHRWVISSDVLAAYRHQLGTRLLPKGGIASELMASFDAVLHDAGRHRWVHQPPIVAGSYEDRDQHMVSAVAAARPAVLVTFDGPLTDSINSDLQDEQNVAMEGFSVMDPHEAVAVLCGET